MADSATQRSKADATNYFRQSRCSGRAFYHEVGMVVGNFSLIGNRFLVAGSSATCCHLLYGDIGICKGNDCAKL